MFSNIRSETRNQHLFEDHVQELFSWRALEEGTYKINFDAAIRKNTSTSLG